MHANELRIGNIIIIRDSKYAKDLDQKEWGVNGETIYLIEKKDIKVEPIPLTEEWLTKLGLTNRNAIDVSGGLFWVDLKHGEVGLSGKESYTIEQSLYAKCKYVHQLQNIYFAITREELKINM